MSNNLGITQLAANQTSPEITANNALGVLDAALTEKASISLSAGNVTVTSGDNKLSTLVVTGATTAGRVLTLNAVKRKISVISDGANTQTFKLKLGATEITMSIGLGATFYTDGTADGLFLVSGGTSSGTTLPAGTSGEFLSLAGTTPDWVPLPVSIGTFVAGKPTASEKLLRYKATRAFTLPVSLTGSQAIAEVAATASTVLTLTKNGSSIGTLTWAIAATVPTIAFTTATSFAVGDVLGVNAPSTADATLADIILNFLGG